MRLFILVFTYLIFSVNFSYAGFGFNESIEISTNKGINLYPDICAKDNLVAITWVQLLKNETILYCRLSYNNGLNWGKPKIVTVFPIKKFIKPSVIIYNNNLLIAADNENNNIELFYENINSFSNFKRILVVSSQNISLLPHLFEFNNSLYLFYQENERNEKFKIKLIKFIDNYTNFTAPQDIIEYKKEPIGNFFPLIKAFGDRIYLIWNDRYGNEQLRNDVIFLKFYDKKFGWSNIFKLSSEDEDASFPSFTLRDDKFHLVYLSRKQEGGNYDFNLKFKIFSVSSNFNITFNNERKFKFSSYYNINLFFHNELFHLIWYSYQKDVANIFYSISEDYSNWGEPFESISGGVKNWNFKIYEGNNGIFMCYQQNFKNYSVIKFCKADEYCAPPVVFSTTHKSNQWSYENSVVLKWECPDDISGIKGYAYAFDKNPETVPDIENLPAEVNGKSFEKVSDGIYYFHLRAIDKLNNFSPPVHYKVMINSAPPEPPIIFSDTHKEIIPSSDRNPNFYWTMKDNREIKGFSILFTQDKNLEPDDKIDTKSTNISFKNVKPGVWYFMVKACDPYNRWSDNAVYTITIEEILLATELPESLKSRFFYKVEKGEKLDEILEKILWTKEFGEQRIYEKDIGEFNYLQNLDFLKEGDVIMFPIIIATPEDTKESLAERFLGTPKLKNKIIVIDKTPDEEVTGGDKIIIKDKYFLRTGEIKGIKSEEEISITNINNAK